MFGARPYRYEHGSRRRGHFARSGLQSDDSRLGPAGAIEWSDEVLLFGRAGPEAGGARALAWGRSGQKGCDGPCR